jgi:hypothetical protein
LSEVLNTSDIVTISKVLGEAQGLDERTWLWTLRDDATNRVLTLTLSVNTDLGDGTMGAIASVQTHQGYLELHDITSMLTIEPDEVMFISKRGEHFSSLVVGRSCTASIFGSVKSALLHADLTTLDPAVLMAAMQLSLAD